MIESIEIWEGLYVLHIDGRVYAKPRRVRCKNGHRTIPGKFLKHRSDSNGYKYVGLHDIDGNCSNQRIHRLLMMTFFPVENMENLVVNHLDGVKANNCISNLEWCTKSENNKHARRIGLVSTDYVYDDYIEALILLRNNKWSNAKIGRAFGRNSSSIAAIFKAHGEGKSQKGHYGGKFYST